jgi:hypothetical protein
MLYAALGREVVQQTVVDYCLASMLCEATRFHYVGKRQQRLSRSLARAREISYDCCTACRMARKELTGGCTQTVRLVDLEGS